MLELARNYAHDEGKKHYVEMIQKPKYIVVRRGHKSVAHQRKLTRVPDDPTTVIQGDRSALTVRTRSIEQEWPNPVLWNQ